MSIELIDGSTITSFIEDDEAFESWIANRFGCLDSDKDGIICYEEMISELENLRLLEKDVEADANLEDIPKDYSLMLTQFDRNSNGKVGKEDFKREIKRIMLAIAESIGLNPLLMILVPGGFLMKAVEVELAKLNGSI